MSNPVVQKGETLLVGIGDYTYEGTIVKTASAKRTANVVKYQDEHGATCTRLIADPGSELKLEILAKAGSTIEELDVGDAVSIDGKNWCIDDVEIVRTYEALKATLSVSLEDSMTSAYS